MGEGFSVMCVRWFFEVDVRDGCELVCRVRWDGCVRWICMVEYRHCRSTIFGFPLHQFSSYFQLFARLATFFENFFKK
jgi:hypothetical protein